MLDLGKGEKLGYRKINFVPVRDTSQQPPPGLLVPLNKEAGAEASAPGPNMPGVGTNSEVEAILARHGGKVQEFCKESSVVLRWATVKRAVSGNQGGRRRNVVQPPHRCIFCCRARSCQPPLPFINCSRCVIADCHGVLRPNSAAAVRALAATRTRGLGSHLSRPPKPLPKHTHNPRASASSTWATPAS